MISTEEKLEIMQRERTAYKKGYRDGLRWEVIILAGCLVSVTVSMMIT